MTFTVTYRGADGALRDEAVEAANRAECFAQCRARGIAPMSVKSEKLRVKCEELGERPIWGRGKALGLLGLLVVLVVLVVLGVLGWLGVPGSKEEAPREPPKRVERPETKPKMPPPASPVATNVQPVETNAPLENQNAGLRKELAQMTKAERKAYAFEEMQKQPIPLEPKSNRIFRTGIEASMARIFMTELGDAPPPFFTTAVPLRDEAHLAEILIAQNPVLETDTEAQKASKEMVALAKKEMIDYIKKGGEPADFLKYYHGKLQEAFDCRRESMKSLMTVAREDPSIAGEYLERVNKELAERGIKQINLTEKQRKRLGLEER